MSQEIRLYILLKFEYEKGEQREFLLVFVGEMNTRKPLGVFSRFGFHFHVKKSPDNQILLQQ